MKARFALPQLFSLYASTQLYVTDATDRLDAEKAG